MDRRLVLIPIRYHTIFDAIGMQIDAYHILQPGIILTCGSEQYVESHNYQMAVLLWD